MTEIAFLSDVHMRTAHAPEIATTLEEICERLSADHDVVHLFVLGDLIEDAGDPERDRTHVRAVADVLEAASIPTTYLLGNHDIESLSRDALATILGQERFYGHLEVAGTPIVYLDSTVDGARARGALGPEQLRWVDAECPDGALVLSHHPIGDFSLADNDWFREYPERAYLWDRKELLATIEDRTLATISGHIHRTATTTFHGLAHASINAVSKETATKPVTGSYAVLSLDGPLRLTRYVRGRRTTVTALA